MFTRCFLSEMDNFHVAPMVFQILGHEPPMAAVWLILTAQQTPVRDDLYRNRVLDPPLAHQPVETDLVGLPVTPPFPVVVQQLLRRCSAIYHMKSILCW